jgi:hypothetical protein
MHGHLERISVSGYSDLSQLSPSISHLHFRKFLSKRLIMESLNMCQSLESVSLSRHALVNCNPDCLEVLSVMGLEIMVSERSEGRPNLLEKNQFKKVDLNIKEQERLSI